MVLFPVTKKMQNLRDEPACHRFLQRFPRLIVGNTTTAMSFASYNAKNVEHIIFMQASQNKQFHVRMNGGHLQNVKNCFYEKQIVQHASTHTKSDFYICVSSKIQNYYPNCNPSHLRRLELSYLQFTHSRNPPNINIR